MPPPPPHFTPTGTRGGGGAAQVDVFVPMLAALSSMLRAQTESGHPRPTGAVGGGGGGNILGVFFNSPSDGEEARSP